MIPAAFSNGWMKWIPTQQLLQAAEGQMDLSGQVEMRQVNVEDFEAEHPVVKAEELQGAEADCEALKR